jgi:hypothetical protein
MKEFQESPDSTIFFRNSIVAALSEFAKNSEFRVAAEELLKNTLVHTWGTIEAFFSDSITQLLNAQPALVSSILANDATKKYFPNKTFSIEILAAYSFNVSNSLGSLLLQDRGLDSLPIIRDVTKALFSEDTRLRESLASDDVWKLWQRRNLIVHKRGVVDQAYVSKTGDVLPIGATLKLTDDDICKCFIRARDIGTALIQSLKGRQSAD